MAATGKADVVVIGGGVIGCSVAYHLARRGQRVVLLERETVGCQASCVAAGMLAPLGEAFGPGPVLSLGMRSLKMFPSLAQELLEATGIDVGYRPTGILWSATDEDEESLLRERYGWQKTCGLALAWLNGEEARRLEPALGPQVVAAVHSPDEHQVSGASLTRALAEGASRAGATILEGATVEGLLCQGRRVEGVRSSAGEWRADCVVLATGSWSGMCGAWLGVRLPVEPIKGQILTFASPSTQPRTIIFGMPELGLVGYVVPKADGTIMVGATEEQAGFDRRPTGQSVSRILKKLEVLAPGILEGELVAARAGLRPRSEDGEPIIGPVPGWEGAIIASGHYRNGILLAPITGTLVADLICGSPDRETLRPFDPARFVPETTRPPHSSAST